MRKLIVILFVFLILSTASTAQSEPLRVVASTTIIADVAQIVGSEFVEVSAIVPADADIHAFQPTIPDVAMISEADIVLVNGAGLEASLMEMIEISAKSNPIVVSEGVTVLGIAVHEDEDPVLGVLGEDILCEGVHDEDEADHDEYEAGDCDAHFWTDPLNVMVWADNIAAAFSEADPDHAEDYAANAEAYKVALLALDEELKARFDALPEENRIIVTNHEFLGYLAYRYGLTVKGVVIPGGSTLTEPDPFELASLINLINETGIRAIFTEATDPRKLAEVVANGVDHPVEIVSLYSGSLSEEGGAVPSYIDYMRANAQLILDALAGSEPAS